jgi:phosphopentomutase
MVLGKQVKPVNMGTRKSFADIAATVAEMLNVTLETSGESFAKEVLA